MNAIRGAVLGATFLLGSAPLCAQTLAIPTDTLARAQAAYAAVGSGKIDRTTLTPALAADLSDAVLVVMTREANAIAKPDSFSVVSQTDRDGVTTTVFRLRTTGGTLDYVFGIDDATDKIAKLYFVPGPSA